MKTQVSRLEFITLIVAAGLLLKASDSSAQGRDTEIPTPVATSAEKSLSPWAAQVDRLARAHIDDAVLLSFVDSAGTFNLTADQIIALTEAGVPAAVIAAMLQHDAEIVSGTREVVASTIPESTLQLQNVLKTWPPLPPQPVDQTPPEQANTQDVPIFFSHEPGADLALCSQTHEEPTEVQEVFPVRKPYPVRLTDTIFIFRGQGRVPNTTVLQGFH